MFQTDLREGIELALPPEAQGRHRSDDLANAIIANALFDDAKGLQLLSLDPDSDILVRYDLTKAALAAAGVVGAAIPLAFDPTGVSSALAALGALGALQGVKQPLGSGCAQLVICLMPRKTMSRTDLFNQFRSSYDGTNEQAEVEFRSCLERLEHLGCVRVKSDVVTLVERVLIRR